MSPPSKVSTPIGSGVSLVQVDANRPLIACVDRLRPIFGDMLAEGEVRSDATGPIEIVWGLEPGSTPVHDQASLKPALDRLREACEHARATAADLGETPWVRHRGVASQTPVATFERFRHLFPGATVRQGSDSVSVPRELVLQTQAILASAAEAVERALEKPEIHRSPDGRFQLVGWGVRPADAPRRRDLPDRIVVSMQRRAPGVQGLDPKMVLTWTPDPRFKGGYGIECDHGDRRWEPGVQLRPDCGEHAVGAESSVAGRRYRVVGYAMHGLPSNSDVVSNEVEVRQMGARPPTPVVVPPAPVEEHIALSPKLQPKLPAPPMMVDDAERSVPSVRRRRTQVKIWLLAGIAALLLLALGLWSWFMNRPYPINTVDASMRFGGEVVPVAAFEQIVATTDPPIASEDESIAKGTDETPPGPVVSPVPPAPRIASEPPVWVPQIDPNGQPGQPLEAPGRPRTAPNTDTPVVPGVVPIPGTEGTQPGILAAEPGGPPKPDDGTTPLAPGPVRSDTRPLPASPPPGGPESTDPPAPRPTDGAESSCPHCKFKLPECANEQWHFCPDCGKPLEGGAHGARHPGPPPVNQPPGNQPPSAGAPGSGQPLPPGEEPRHDTTPPPPGGATQRRPEAVPASGRTPDESAPPRATTAGSGSGAGGDSSPPTTTPGPAAPDATAHASSIDTRVEIPVAAGDLGSMQSLLESAPNIDQTLPQAVAAGVAVRIDEAGVGGEEFARLQSRSLESAELAGAGLGWAGLSTDPAVTAAHRWLALSVKPSAMPASRSALPLSQAGGPDSVRIRTGNRGIEVSGAPAAVWIDVTPPAGAVGDDWVKSLAFRFVPAAPDQPMPRIVASAPVPGGEGTGGRSLRLLCEPVAGRSEGRVEIVHVPSGQVVGRTRTLRLEVPR